MRTATVIDREGNRREKVKHTWFASFFFGAADGYEDAYIDTRPKGLPAGSSEAEDHVGNGSRAAVGERLRLSAERRFPLSGWQAHSLWYSALLFTSNR